MNRVSLIAVVLLAGAIVGACSTTSPNARATHKPSGAIPPYANKYQAVQDRLYSQYNQWRGTRYKNGGLGKNGVDCSGFVYMTYLQQFGVQIPRSTASQSKMGYKVPQLELRPGDLVFFKTGWKGRHVGIYINNKSFLHASTSSGVIISRLDNVYWQSKYWHARRFDF